jgi:rubrerythrin
LLSEINEAPFNYNLHSQNQIDELSKSLDQFGQFKNIVLWNGYCIAGNGLVFAAKHKGWKDLFAIIRDDLSEEQAKALCVADNATPYLAIVDDDKLNNLLSSIESPLDIPGVDKSWLKSQMINIDQTIKKETDQSYNESDENEDDDESQNDFKEFDENIDTDYMCPKCGYEWSGNPK